MIGDLGKWTNTEYSRGVPRPKSTADVIRLLEAAEHGLYAARLAYEHGPDLARRAAGAMLEARFRVGEALAVARQIYDEERRASTEDFDESVGEAMEEAKKPRLGSGERFKVLSKDLKQKGVDDPDALAASIGRKKYGKEKMAKLAAAGRKRESFDGDESVEEGLLSEAAVGKVTQVLRALVTDRTVMSANFLNELEGRLKKYGKSYGVEFSAEASARGILVTGVIGPPVNETEEEAREIAELAFGNKLLAVQPNPRRPGTWLATALYGMDCPGARPLFSESVEEGFGRRGGYVGGGDLAEQDVGKLVIYHGAMKVSEARDGDHAVVYVKGLLRRGATNIFVTSLDLKRTIKSYLAWARREEAAAWGDVDQAPVSAEEGFGSCGLVGSLLAEAAVSSRQVKATKVIKNMLLVSVEERLNEYSRASGWMAKFSVTGNSSGITVVAWFREPEEEARELARSILGREFDFSAGKSGAQGSEVWTAKATYKLGDVFESLEEGKVFGGKPSPEFERHASEIKKLADRKLWFNALIYLTDTVLRDHDLTEIAMGLRELGLAYEKIGGPNVHVVARLRRDVWETALKRLVRSVDNIADYDAIKQVAEGLAEGSVGEAFGRRSRSGGGDPRWMTAKYPGKASDGTPFRKGEEVLYYPLTKTFMAGEKAKQAWREFMSAKGDEEGMPYAETKCVESRPKAGPMQRHADKIAGMTDSNFHNDAMLYLVDVVLKNKKLTKIMQRIKKEKEALGSMEPDLIKQRTDVMAKAFAELKAKHPEAYDSIHAAF